ncbi:MAG: MXAN_5187 C-terminal domain-containing protein, partial [Myxococcota bacterium]
VELPLMERRPFVPELVFVTDEKGVGVAALGKGKYSWYNENVASAFPSILSVADGKPRTETWLWRWDKGGKLAMYSVGIAPVLKDKTLIGVVVVGHLVNDGKAEQDSAALGGQDIAYMHGDQIYASTLSPASEEALSAQLFGKDSPLGSSSEPGIISINVAGDRMLALVRYDPMDEKSRSGAVVLTNLKHELASVEQIRAAIPIFTLVLLVAMLTVVLLAFSSFVKPFEEIDQGIHEVLAGNKDYVFKVSANYAFQTEMAHSLNLMSAYLQGKPMPDEEDHDDAWQDFLVSEVTQTSLMRAIQGNSPNGGDANKPAVVAVPVATDEEKARNAYQRRIFDEYITAKKRLGEDVSEIDYEGFVERMKKNVAKLKVRHNARDIRFSVVVRDGKVVLKPQPVM